MTTQEAIKAFIIDQLDYRGSPNDLTATYPLIDREAIDSMGILQIVGFVEDEFGVEVGDEDLVVDNFASIEAIATMVERNQS